MPAPAYTRLNVDARRRQLLEAGSRLFAEHAYEEITMRQIADAAGISKPLLYHYFASKSELFKAAVAEQAEELQALIEPTGTGTPLEQLSASLDAYLAWIEANQHTWAKLMQSASTVPEAREAVDNFRTQTLQQLSQRLTDIATPPPALRAALHGWLANIDATILDWTTHSDLTRDQVKSLLLATFAAALHAAGQADPTTSINAQ